VVKSNARVDQRGGSGMGCLASLVLLAVLGYYGISFGRVYWRYFEMTDRMKKAARSSYTHSDEQIVAQLRQDAREIGIPGAGSRVQVRRMRSPSVIIISTEYTERIDLPLVHRTIKLAPKIEFRIQ